VGHLRRHVSLVGSVVSVQSDSHACWAPVTGWSRCLPPIRDMTKTTSYWDWRS
jgi:hypothetical protein